MDRSRCNEASYGQREKRVDQSDHFSVAVLRSPQLARNPHVGDFERKRLIPTSTPIPLELAPRRWGLYSKTMPRKMALILVLVLLAALCVLGAAVLVFRPAEHLTQ